MDKRKVFCAAMAAALLFHVGGWAQEGPGPENPPVLYAAGWEESGDSKRAATVWKIDGSAVTSVPLTDGTRSAEVYGLAESGGGDPPVLYAAGFEKTGGTTVWETGGIKAAMVWKIDGATVTPVPLTGGTREAEAWGITESGGSLYAAGYEYHSGTRVAMVWKISGATVTPITLAGGTRNAAAKGIAESGGSLYAAGVEENSGGAAPMVWKIDGSTVTPVPLPGGTRYAEAWGLAESGGSLYAAGWELHTDDNWIATVWKIDGSAVTPVPLTGGRRPAQAWGVAAGGDSLYAAGKEYSGSHKWTATVWKIGGSRVTPIPLTDGTREAEAKGIAESGSPPVLYAAGFELNGEGTFAALVWKIEGARVTPIPLTGGTRNAGASAVIAP